jgi:glutathione S-transferase
MNPQMPDFYGFPHISRLFYMEGTKLDSAWQQMKIPERYPHLCGWFKLIREDPAF